MKTIKAWAVIEKSTVEIFRDSIDGGKVWELYIRRGAKRRIRTALMDAYGVVRVEIREVKPKRKARVSQ